MLLRNRFFRAVCLLALLWLEKPPGDAQAAVLATGGTVTYDSGYEIHTFTGSSSFVVTAGGSVEYLVVGGGGGGGYDAGGGGGAGGLLTGTIGVTPQSYAITVGAGGPGGASPGANATPQNGGNSLFGSLVTALGGGGGGNYNTGLGGNGAAGGSGGGGSGYVTPGSAGLGTVGQGFNGGATGTVTSLLTGSGGGGAGGIGATGVQGSSSFAAGGIGLISSITGSPLMYAVGGDGAGDTWPGWAAGTPNTGNGGDAHGFGGLDESGSLGGSGIVIIRFAGLPPVPEPGSCTLCLLGLGGLRSLKRKASASVW